MSSYGVDAGGRGLGEPKNIAAAVSLSALISSVLCIVDSRTTVLLSSRGTTVRDGNDHDSTSIFRLCGTDINGI